MPIIFLLNSFNILGSTTGVPDLKIRLIRTIMLLLMVTLAVPCTIILIHIPIPFGPLASI